MGFFDYISDRAQDFGHSLTHTSDWQADGSIAHTWDGFTKWMRGENGEDPKSAGPPPNPLVATNTAAANSLANQQRQASTWNILTGGQGVLDSTPGSSPRLLGF